jgi:hypothetical protein
LVASHLLIAQVELLAASHNYRLVIDIDGRYSGPATYDLSPWKHPNTIGVNDVPKVAVIENASGDFWQSVSGVLRVDDTSPLSGFVVADLSFNGGGPTPRLTSLTISGDWSCSRIP